MNRTSRDTWNLINAALGKSKATQSLDRSTARSFNEFFCSVGSNTQASDNATSCLNETAYGPPRVVSTKFGLRPATHSELRSVLHSLSVHTSSGPDGLPPSLFKCFLGRLASPLLHVFNFSITRGIVSLLENI